MTEVRVKQRLAAIFTADVAGYSRGRREAVAWFYDARPGSSGLASSMTLFTPKAQLH